MVSVDVYIDVMDTLSSFQHVDWIRELTADLHSILMKKVDVWDFYREYAGCSGIKVLAGAKLPLLF